MNIRNITDMQWRYLNFKETNRISLDDLKKDIEDFVTPQSYIYLDNRPTLLKYMEKKIVRKGLNIKHDFSSITSDQICRC